MRNQLCTEEKTRVQYEFDFECEALLSRIFSAFFQFSELSAVQATSWNYIRMPFNAFKAVRTDGVPLPEDVAGKPNSS